jgi:DNA polymerase III epsilon subunit-like protein
MPICVLDTETTGFVGNPRSSVIELGAVVLTKEGTELGTFSSYVRPTYPLGRWSARALEVCRITPEQLHGAPLPAFVWEQFVSWLSEYKPVTEVLAFNKPFDAGMMAKTFPGSEHLPWGDCLMRRAGYEVRGHRRQIKLTAVCEYAQIEVHPERSHRAMYDAQLTGQVYSWLQSRV